MFSINFTHSYQQLPDEFYRLAMPEPATQPKVVIANTDLAQSLGLSLELLDEPSLAALLSGNALPDSASPIAQAYAGHQFGHLNLLGDGRAVLLGELHTDDGRLLDWQLKGSGRTPFSRNGDGKAALAPMLREYIISEAMFALGIPTTRSLAVVTSGDVVHRKGRRPAAILSRIADSHLRVGTFVYAAIISQQRGDSRYVQALLEYAISRHYPHVADDDNPALAFLSAVMQKQIDVLNQWWRVGFIHGVLNTDNIAISGETIDYGPCAFLEHYDPQAVFSSIDHGGRYAFDQQASVMQWNLARLAEALLPLIDADENRAIDLAEECINRYPTLQQTTWGQVMRQKIGFTPRTDQQAEADDLLQRLLTIMHSQRLDYTNTFVFLTQLHAYNVGVKSDNIRHSVSDYFQLDSTSCSAYFDTNYWHDDFIAWCKDWQQLLAESNRYDVLSIMQSSNPTLIARNIGVEEALTAAENGDVQPFKAMLSALSRPYDWSNMASIADYQRRASAEDLAHYQTFCGT